MLLEISKVIEKDHSGQLCIMIGIIEMKLGHNTKAKSLFEQSAECCPNICKLFLENQEIILTPLHTGTDFSKKFEFLEFPEFKNVRFRPAIRLPSLIPPLEMDHIYELLLGMIDCNTIVSRPEAP